MTALLSTTYFGPVQWYQKLYRHPHVLLEHCESFQKQTYRNRCLIATTQGIQALTVPVVGTPITDPSSPTSHHPITTLRISDHGNWRHQHWNALCTAYRESPFFDYYEDDLRPFFERHWTYLVDFNEAIMAKMCELLDIHPDVSPTTHYRPASDSQSAQATQKTDGIADFRDAIRPKHPLPDADFQPRPYYQVYAPKHGFLPNLSILDLLCNMGPESIFYL